VTCDFLNARGMSMPVVTIDGQTWVGLIAATFVQRGDSIDVWPVVTTLFDDGSTRQYPKPLLYGCVRFGGTLPEVDGLSVFETGNATVCVPEGEGGSFADAWIIRPALAAANALRLLEAVNVTLEPADLSRAATRRAGREGADIPLEVVIRTSRRETTAPVTTGSVDWQHRWTVRGHLMHFKRGPIFNANPRKRVDDPKHGECVIVWCPVTVKGPADKPLILKARRLESP
jgi:hypothetical protein